MPMLWGKKATLKLPLILCFVIMILATAVLMPQPARALEGEGTDVNPYRIYTAEDLNSVREDVYDGAYFQLQNDIDLSGTVWGQVYAQGNGTGGWEPIGYRGDTFLGISDNPFQGHFDGNHHAISGLFIDRSEFDVGLFGYAENAVFKNLELKGVQISANGTAGALVGRMSNGEISSCSAAGTVSGQGDLVGGLVGTNAGVINKSYADVVVSGESWVGGLAGSNNSSILNSYALGDVSGSVQYLGGLVGRNSGTVENSFSAGAVTGAATDQGGLTGNNIGTVSNSFYDSDTSGQSDTGKGESKTTAEMKCYKTFFPASWDFLEETRNGTEDIWGIDEVGNGHDGYPFLAWQADKEGYSHNVKPVVNTVEVKNIKTDTADVTGDIADLGNISTITQHGVCWSTVPNPDINDNKTERGSTASTGEFTSAITGLQPETIYYVRAYATDDLGTTYYGEEMEFKTVTYAGGTGTQEDPYQILTADQLNYVRNFLNDPDIYFVLNNDIDLTAYLTSGGEGYALWGASGWLPIGDDTERFLGHFDGNSYKITGLTINRGSAEYMGLFGVLGEGGTVNNTGLENVSVAAGNYTGGMAGKIDGGAIDNCYVTGEVTGNNDVGGLAGYNHAGTISDSHSDSTVEGNERVGGLLGQNYRDHNSDAESIISDSYAAGNVTGRYYVGGLLGQNHGNSYNADVFPCTVTNSYATGAVAGQRYAGGLVGQNDLSNIYNSYATGSVTGGDKYLGGLAGHLKSLGTIKNSYSKGAVTTTGDAAGTYGGFIGLVQNGASVEHCYSTGSVYISQGGAPEGRGFVGYNDGDNTYTGNFLDIELSNQNSGTGAEAKTTAEMKDYFTFLNTGWDFMEETGNGGEDVWGIDETGAGNDGYPFLSWQGYDHNYLPRFHTVKVMEIGPTTAVATGNITDLGNMGTTQHGMVWSTLPGPTVGDSKTEEGGVSATGKFTSQITGLNPGITYYVRAYLTGNYGTSYGEELQFTTTSFAGGVGTAADPYQIETVAQLNDVRNYLDSHFILMNDIDLTAYLASGEEGYALWGASGWLPIGNDTERFLGHFDGNNHQITGLTINRGSAWHIGLFGVLGKGGTIKNTGIAGEVTGYDEVGGLAGKNYYGTIDNCYFTGTKTISGNNDVGGLVGYNYGGLVSNSHADCPVEGNERVGGLIGRNYHDNASVSNTTITSSHATGDVTGQKNVGGLAGENHSQFNYGCEITGSYATGTVTGGSNVGGLVGLSDGKGRIINSYATGTVAGNGAGNENIGGLIGFNKATVRNSYSDNRVSGENYVGGLVGYNYNHNYDNNPIINSYALGDVNGSGQYLGGLVGQNDSTVENSFAAGAVTGEAANKGGLIGANTTDPNLTPVVSNSFYDSETSGQSDTGKGEPKTTAEMKTYATFFDAGWDFVGETQNGEEDIWDMDETGIDNGGYPFLAWQDYTQVATYTVDFGVEGQNGTLEAKVDGEAIDSGDKVEEGKDVDFTAVPDEGYQVKNWEVNGETVTGNTSNNLTVENLQEETSVTVELEAITHNLTVEIVAGEGTAEPSVGEYEYNEGAVLTLTAVPADGWEFEKWVVNGTEYTTAGIEVTMDGDKTAEAYFALNSVTAYTVTYDGNGGNGTAPAESDKVEGETFIAADNTFTAPSGKQFKEWNTASNGTGTGYLPGETVTMPASDLILYAIWEDIPSVTCTVTFDSNGGNSVDSQTVEHGSTAVKPADPTREGYTFNGWYLDEGLTIAYDFSTEVTKDITLYAGWTANENKTYTVTYDGNGATGGEVPVDNNSYEEGMEVTVLGNTGNLVRTGHSFAGWNTRSDGGGTGYTAGETFSMGNADVTLYANWISGTAAEDEDPPTVPDNLHMTGRTSSSITIAWNASEDAGGIEKYQIQRKTGDGDYVIAGETGGTTYKDTGLNQSTTYTYRVRAEDASQNGNLSAWSTPLTATTLSASSGGGGSGSNGGSGGGGGAITPPAGNVVNSRIDSEKGGTITYNGGVRVIIPPGSLKDDATFTIKRLSESEVKNIVPEGMLLYLAGRAWEITTSGERAFDDNTITIKIPYEGDETPVIHWLDEDNWVPLPTTVEEIDGRQYAVIRVNHLTLFAVFMEETIKKQKVINLTIGKLQAAVDGKPYQLDAVPVIGEGSRTLVPIRFVAEALGAGVKWDGAAKKVIISDGDTGIILTVGSTRVVVNGGEVTLDCAPQIKPPGRTFVPLRFVSETFGAKVDYDSPTKQVTITR